MSTMMSNMRPVEAASQQPPPLIHPPTSKRSRDTSTLTQSTIEPSYPPAETKSKRRSGKVPKIPAPTRATTQEESIDFPPEEEMVDYAMNRMQQDYGPYPEYRDDPDFDDPQL